MTRDSGPEEAGPVHHSFQITARNRVGAIAMAIAVIALGGVFLVFGLVLLAGLAAVGTVVGAGMMAYHRITGRWPGFLRRSTTTRTALDPSREVFAGDAPSSGTGHNDTSLPPRV